MIVWDILNSLFRLGIAAICIWKLWRFYDLFNPMERYGMSLAAGTSLLTITVIWEGARSPYDGWANSLFSLAILVYFVGRMSRHWRHEANNRAQIRQGRLR